MAKSKDAATEVQDEVEVDEPAVEAGTTAAAEAAVSATPEETAAGSTAAVETPIETPEVETPAPSPFASVIEHARQFGIQPPDGEDPSQFVNGLLMAHLERDRVKGEAEYARRYRENATAFEKWQAEQGKAAAAEKPKTIFERKPEFDPRWLSMVDRDAQGRLVSKSGVPADVAAKVEAYAQWKQDYDWEQTSNPQGFFQPLIQKQVEEQVKLQVAAIQQQTQSQSFLDANKDWMYVPGQTDVMGRQLLSPSGQRFWAHVREAKESGVQNPAVAYDMALRMVTGEVAMQQLNSGKPAVADAERKKDLLKTQAAKTAGRNGVTTKAKADVSANGLTMRESLAKAFAEEGVEV